MVPIGLQLLEQLVYHGLSWFPIQYFNILSSHRRIHFTPFYSHGCHGLYIFVSLIFIKETFQFIKVVEEGKIPWCSHLLLYIYIYTFIECHETSEIKSTIFWIHFGKGLQNSCPLWFSWIYPCIPFICIKCVFVQWDQQWNQGAFPICWFVIRASVGNRVRNEFLRPQ